MSLNYLLNQKTALILENRSRFCVTMMHTNGYRGHESITCAASDELS